MYGKRKKLSTDEYIELNKERFIEFLNEKPWGLKYRIRTLKKLISNTDKDDKLFYNTGDMVSFRKDLLISELKQILDARTESRAIYYIKRLKKSINRVKKVKINDINLARWKEYDNLLTDSLWVLDRRDTSGAHFAWYWGNFVPQIPQQMILRYTRKGEWIIDTFAGSGTTLIEAQRLARNCIGVELNPMVANKAKELIEVEDNKYNVVRDVIEGDSRSVDYKKILSSHNINSVQLVIMHPPYHNIIRFSDDYRDLSNAEETKIFLNMFGETLDNVDPFLERGRYLIVIIGDKYSKREWIPLGFYCMNEVMKRGYSLKSIIVKNFDGTRGKRSNKELWRYRALAGGFYVFKHEYIFLFKKEDLF